MPTLVTPPPVVWLEYYFVVTRWHNIMIKQGTGHDRTRQKRDKTECIQCRRLEDEPNVRQSQDTRRHTVTRCQDHVSRPLETKQCTVQGAAIKQRSYFQKLVNLRRRLHFTASILSWTWQLSWTRENRQFLIVIHISWTYTSIFI